MRQRLTVALRPDEQQADQAVQQQQAARDEGAALAHDDSRMPAAFARARVVGRTPRPVGLSVPFMARENPAPRRGVIPGHF